jgi:predicted MPP superfamily phosphohydrolase
VGIPDGQLGGLMPGKIPNIVAFIPLILACILVLLGFFSGPATRRRWWTVSLVTFLCAALDAVMLMALPRLGLSYGTIDLPLAGMNSIRLAVLAACLLIISFFKSRQKLARVVTVTGIAIQFILLALAVDGFCIEPFHLTVTQVRQEAPAFLPDRPLRIVHLSDLHVERITIRERAMIEKVNELDPDIIVLTGDYLNQEYLDDPLALEEARTVLMQLRAPYGVYAVSGTTDLPEIMTGLFTGLDNIRVLSNEVAPVMLPGGTLYLVGVTNHWTIETDQQALADLLAQSPVDRYDVLLYHTPDLIETAAANHVSLYFAGHTHGGQIRLPFYGAIVTLSMYHKQFEMGEYHVGPTTLYVSRGIGMEGLGLPRIRFLCPPEIVVMDLVPLFK